VIRDLTWKSEVMVVETDWLSPASVVGQHRRHHISSPWTLLSYLWQLPIMLAAETFPGEGGSLLLDWTMDPPTLAAKMTGEGAELTLLRPPSCRTSLSTQVLNAGLYVYGCLSKRSTEIRSSNNRYGLTWEKEKGRRREVWKLERWLWPVATPGVGIGEVGCGLTLYIRSGARQLF